MKGALVVLLRRPSQLKPSNHLCFWISLIPPRPNPNRSEGFSLKQINVKHCLFSKCFYSIFSIQRWSIYILCCRFHPFRSFFSSCYFTSRMWFQVMLHYKKVFLCLLKMDCMMIKSIGFVINGRWIYNYLCNKCTDVVSSNLDRDIKFVSNLRQVGGFLRVLQFLPPIKLTATI